MRYDVSKRVLAIACLTYSIIPIPSRSIWACKVARLRTLEDSFQAVPYSGTPRPPCYFMYPVLLYSNLTVPGKICYSLRSAMSYYTSPYARRYAPLPYFTYDTWYGIFPSVDLPRPFDSLTISRPETLVLQPRPRRSRQLRPPPFQSLARLPVGRVEGPYRRGAEGTSSG
jgi:hypothetical protein